jgi:HlyD family secretion protein
MDIARPSGGRKRRLRKFVYAGLGLCALLLVSLGIARLKPAALGVERSTLLIGSVQRGSMLRQVRGMGTLVPEEVRVIAASTQGRVEAVLVHPGTVVSAGTALLRLSNPELEQVAQDAEFQLRAAEADTKNLRVRLESERMSQQAAAASVKADYEQARLQFDTDEALAKEGLIPALNLKLSRVKTDELANRYKIEQQRLEVNSRSTQAQLAAQQARVLQLQALIQLKHDQVRALTVLASTDGVLQQMQAEVGQQVEPGTVLARVVEPRHLKAELKITETQAKDVQLGQTASIDTHNGVINGHVSRIDPAVQQGTVAVDVALDGSLPQGARPDLSVDGLIELERLENVLYVNRPATGQAQSTVGLFKLEDGGQRASRVQVQLGRSSASTIEVREGLGEGDQVILSDTSAWDNQERIRLK